ncbi:uncharacterized protein EAF02_005471 [Botrytis sinoallii]|uniref:uncharacterized protein n=1 Tax=Botrytis sinoallii TaxID=1463999 RepID=UPI001900C6E3|nr:uncharacterized protein EAF02_005471 [Botrytis sinoallii]KAF7883551.1 hypothetical protein EAF02_005471 [Botrytis sinoallii]
MGTSTVVPAACYSVCNNAYVDALKIGNEPSLCSNSPFNKDYSSCQECVAANSSDPAAVNEEYLEPQFRRFFQYCASLNASSIASSIVESTTVATSLSVASSLLSSLPNFTTTFLSSTSTPSGSPYATITATNTQDISLFNGSTITITFSNVITLWTQTSSTSSSSPTSLQSKLTPGHAQFNGIVVGCIFGGLSIIAFGMIYWKFWRHRHLRKSSVGAGIGDETGPEKAQLHSDCIPPKTPEEIDGAPKGPVAELPAIEAVVEMPGSVNYLPREVE